MAIVKPLKISTDGSQIECNPSSDYISTKGISLDGTTNVTIENVSGQIQFKDTEVSPITLKQILDMINGSGSIKSILVEKVGDNMKAEILFDDNSILTG